MKQNNQSEELAIIEKLAGGNLSHYLGDNALGDINNALGDDDKLHFFGSIKSLADEAAMFINPDRLKALGNGPNFKFRLTNTSNANTAFVMFSNGYDYAPGSAQPNGVIRDGAFTPVNADGTAGTANSVTAQSMSSTTINNLLAFHYGSPTRAIMKIQATTDTQAGAQMTLQHENPYELEGIRYVDISADMTSKDFNPKIVFVQRVLQFDKETIMRYSLEPSGSVIITIYPVASDSRGRTLRGQAAKSADVYSRVKKQVDLGILKRQIGLIG